MENELRDGDFLPKFPHVWLTGHPVGMSYRKTFLSWFSFRSWFSLWWINISHELIKCLIVLSSHYVSLKLDNLKHVFCIETVFLS